MKLTEEVIAHACDGTLPSSVTNLSLPNKNLQEISCLKAHKNLVRLDLSHNHLQSIEALSNCTNLQWLSVASNELRSLDGIKGLLNLLVLNCSYNQLTNLGEVEGLFGLKALIANDNEISAIGQLQKLTALSTLVLSKNPIAGFGAALENVSSLNKLSLSHCKLQKLGSIKQLVDLKELRLAHNNLKNLSKDIAKNSKLLTIDLGSNCIKNLSDVEVLSTLSYLRNLNVQGNPVCLQAGYEEKLKTSLPALQILNGHSLRNASKKKASNQQTVSSSAMTQLKAGDAKDLHNSDKTTECENIDKALETGASQRGQIRGIKKLQKTEKASKKKSVTAAGVQDSQIYKDGSHSINHSVKTVEAQEGQTSEDRQEKSEKPKKRRKSDASVDEDIRVRELRKERAFDDSGSEPFIDLIGQGKPDTHGSKGRPHSGQKKEDSGLVSITHNQSKLAKQNVNKHIATVSPAFSIYVGEAEVGGGGQSSWT